MECKRGWNQAAHTWRSAFGKDCAYGFETKGRVLLGVIGDLQAVFHIRMIKIEKAVISGAVLCW